MFFKVLGIDKRFELDSCEEEAAWKDNCAEFLRSACTCLSSQESYPKLVAAMPFTCDTSPKLLMLEEPRRTHRDRLFDRGRMLLEFIVDKRVLLGLQIW